MAGFNDIQRSSAQSIQSAIAGGEATDRQGQQSQVQSAPMGRDAATLTGGGPSYMQAIETLMFSQIALNLNGGNSLGNLHALSSGGDVKSTSKDGDKNLSTNYGKNDNFGVFNPSFYAPSNVGGRNGNGNSNGGNGGYGSGGRTGAGNVTTGGIDRMLELILAQTLGQNSGSGDEQKLHSDAVTLVGRSPDSQANAFHELTGALVMLLSEQMNKSGENASMPSPQMRQLLSRLTDHQQHQNQPAKGSNESLSQPQLQALMDEMAVMQLIQGTRNNDSGAANPMVNSIMELMQSLLGAQSGGSVSSSQMQNLLGALMNNLKNEAGGDSSPATAMMQQMLPEMMAMLEAEDASTPGHVAPKQNSGSNNASSSHDNPVRLSSFNVSVASNGALTGSSNGGNSQNKSSMKPDANGGLMILDGSKSKDIAGGFGIGGSVGKDKNNNDSIQVGTFSWNSGQDAIALNAQGGAAVTSDAGGTWAPLPAQGVSTYNPGNGGPTLTYNPNEKSVAFTATGENKDTISAEMRADDNGVNFANIRSTGVTAGGQLASALT